MQTKAYLEQPTAFMALPTWIVDMPEMFSWIFHSVGTT